MDRKSREKASSISVVIPCYNEEAVLPELRRRLETSLNALGISWEVVFVDDGSKDGTGKLLKQYSEENPRLKAVCLSRNFGHQPALFAGLSTASGETVAVLDADLQDPPELLESCLALWKNGADVVYAVRKKRKENIFKRFCYAAFYRVLSNLSSVEIPLDSGDFCLMDRRVVDTMISLREKNIFVRGLRAWSGFSQVGLEYERAARVAGRTKYSISKLVALALDGIFSFSTRPLRLATYLGLSTVACCVAAILFVVVWRISGSPIFGTSANEIPGWSAGITAVLFLGGLQLLVLGILGEYIGRIFVEVKGRPAWVEKERYGFDSGKTKDCARVDVTET